MKFGCCIKRIEDIAAVQQAGYDYFEFSGTVIAKMEETAFRRMLSLVKELDFPCIGFNSYCDGSPAIVGPAFDPAAIAAYAKTICARGHRLGIRSIGIGAPAARRLPPQYPHSLAQKQCMEFLKITAAEAEKYDISILFEAVHENICDFAVFTEEAAEITQQLALPNMGMVLDFYHMHVMGEPIENAEIALPHLQHVHISTCGPHLERGYPDQTLHQEYQTILSWLKEHQYDQTVSIEADAFLPEAAAAAVKMLREIDLSVSPNFLPKYKK